MILVYSHKITPRLTYSFKQIFKRILQMEILFTNKIDEFIAHDGPKLSYTKNPLGNEFFVRNHLLLYEQGIRDVEFKVHDWNGIPSFFSVGEQSAIPYDIFAATFFLVSRYEEYYPQVHDEYDRYFAQNSTAVQNGFLDKPLIDIWAYRLLDLLKLKFPDYPFPQRHYQQISTINVNEAFAYQHKGFFRNTAGFIRDLTHFKMDEVVRRFLVLIRVKKDPYDNYDEIIQLTKSKKVKTIFFFLFSEYNTYDKNVSFSNYGYKMLVKSVVDFVPFGQLFSYFTMKDTPKLIKEKNRFENVVIRPVIKSRQHFNRLEIPRTYQTLIDNDIREEYTMGYHTQMGFRAGTCSPFYFYDLDYEIQTPLKVFPFCVTDELLKLHLKLSPQEALEKIRTLQQEVKKVNGLFISIFHNAILSDMESNKDWADVYEEMLQSK